VTTVVFLIRHGHTDAIGSWLPGRASGVTLSTEGQAQVDRLGQRVGPSHRLSAIYTSPLERARATAAALARHQQPSVRVHDCDDLTDIDFGAWTGKTFLELAADPAWHTFNTARSTAVVPGGESAAAVQQRIVGAIVRLAARHREQTIALVSHADVIRFALLQYQSLSLDLYDRFEIDPASVSAISVSNTGTSILYINTTFVA
jgi:broad specificity phosphatase PhoE